MGIEVKKKISGLRVEARVNPNNMIPGDYYIYLKSSLLMCVCVCSCGHNYAFLGHRLCAAGPQEPDCNTALCGKSLADLWPMRTGKTDREMTAETAKRKKKKKKGRKKVWKGVDGEECFPEFGFRLWVTQKPSCRNA